MAIGIDAPKLIASKAKEFKSVNVKGLRLINQNFYPQSGNYPIISSSKILDGNSVNSEYSIKKFADGTRLEVYRMKDAVLKLVKNKFGEIKAFKYRGAGEKADVPRENIIENTKLSFAAKVRSFFD